MDYPIPRDRVDHQKERRRAGGSFSVPQPGGSHSHSHSSYLHHQNYNHDSYCGRKSSTSSSSRSARASNASSKASLRKSTSTTGSHSYKNNSHHHHHHHHRKSSTSKSSNGSKENPIVQHPRPLESHALFFAQQQKHAMKENKDVGGWGHPSRSSSSNTKNNTLGEKRESLPRQCNPRQQLGRTIFR